MTVTVWADGRLSDGSQPAVSALDHGLTVGDGVFETCLVLHNQAFALTRHLGRLGRSAAALGLVVPPDAELRRAVDQTLDAAGPLPAGRLRITLTGGPGPLGSGRGEAPPTLIVVAAPAAPWPARNAAVSVPWTRNERSAVAGVKTTSYAENVIALGYAHERGGTEALFGNTRGELCEGTGSNVVVERGGVLVTPPLASGCLAGITRELLLEWAAQEGLPVIEDVVTMAELAAAPEVLLTSSTRDVQHVTDLDGRPVDGTSLGKAAGELFGRRAAGTVEP